MTKQTELITYIFDEQLQHRPEAVRLSAELLHWLDTSVRFTSFVETYRDKIRKKIRVTREAESVLDVRAELEVAYSLLDDRRLSVAYEPYASAKHRGADFSVTYRDNLVFNIEVARIRVEASEGDEIELSRKEERILRILLDKLGQMQPGMPNLLVIHTHPALVRSIDLGSLIQAMKTKAEAKDPAFYAASRYTSTAAFYKDFQRLSGILLWAHWPKSSSLDSPLRQLWVNKQARPLPAEKVLRVVEAVGGGQGI